MKKAYQKPELFAESFELAEHISNCSSMGHANHQDAYTCTYDYDGIQIFVEGKNLSCKYNPVEEEDEDLIPGMTFQCEYSFLDSGRVFSS